ncbi:MAG: SdrD B-like domain-containing protein, partial [Oscillochloridaceae bacterium umkhey_bin13]
MGSEPGIPGVTVRLFQDVNNDGLIDSRDPLISTAFTLNNGTYEFLNLANGTYYVVVDRTTLPGGILPTQDLDEIGRCVVCNSIGRAVVNNANVDNQDFGYLPEGPLSIGDTVWYDRNGDGQQVGVQETGISGVTVNLQVWNPATSSYITVRTTSTDSNGKYIFDTLPPGTYRVVVDTTDPSIPADAFGNRFAPTTPVSREITLTNADNLTADFGFTALAAIGDTVYYDANRNGDQDFGEPGVAGVTVNLTNADAFTAPDGTFYDVGDYTRTITTDSNGNYLFSGLPSTTDGVRYTITVDNTTGGLLNRPQTADPNRDGAACNVTNVGGTACPVGTNCDLNADFGYRFFSPTGYNISGTICVDGTVTTGLCGTGDSGVDIAGGEAPFAGRTVYLYRRSAGGDVVLAAVDTTAANGDYSFTSLPATTGTERYIVALAAPGSNQSLTTTSTTPGAGSTVVPTNSGSVNLSAQRIFELTANRTNQDFAYVSTLSFDYGDAPASYGVVLSGAPAGPRHQIPSGGATVYLGTMPPDAEPNSIAAALNGAAVSDDNDDAVNDEDGVRITQNWGNGTDGGTVQITVTGPAGSTVWLTGWVDFNKDGSFGGSGEQIVNEAVSILIGQTSVTALYTFDTPANLFPTGGTSNISLYARFRVFTAEPLLSALAFVGDTVNGEVEDYQFNFVPTAVTLIDFTATWVEQGVRLDWATASERDTQGFQLWRAASPNQAEATMITPELIYAEGDSVSGWNYAFDDLSAEAGATYFYWLEEVRTDGSSEFFGPVVPRPPRDPVAHRDRPARPAIPSRIAIVPPAPRSRRASRSSRPPRDPVAHRDRPARPA